MHYVCVIKSSNNKQYKLCIAETAQANAMIVDLSERIEGKDRRARFSPLSINPHFHFRGKQTDKTTITRAIYRNYAADSVLVYKYASI